MKLIYIFILVLLSSIVQANIIIVEQGYYGGIPTGNEANFSYVAVDFKSKSTIHQWLLSPNSVIFDVDLTAKNIYNCDHTPILDDKNKQITVKWETSKCSGLDCYSIALTEAQSINIGKCIILGNSSYPVYWQELEYVEYSNKNVIVNVSWLMESNGTYITVESNYSIEGLKFSGQSDFLGNKTQKLNYKSNQPIIYDGNSYRIFLSSGKMSDEYVYIESDGINHLTNFSVEYSTYELNYTWWGNNSFDPSFSENNVSVFVHNGTASGDSDIQNKELDNTSLIYDYSTVLYHTFDDDLYTFIGAYNDADTLIEGTNGKPLKIGSGLYAMPNKGIRSTSTTFDDYFDGDMSIFVKAKIDSVYTNMKFVRMSNMYTLDFSSTTLRFYVWGANSDGVCVELASGGYPINDWFTLTAIKDNSTGTGLIYINGVLATNSSSCTQGTMDNPTSYFAIASQDGNQLFFNGTINTVGIWNRTLNNDEILELNSSSHFDIPATTTSPVLNLTGNGTVQRVTAFNWSESVNPGVTNVSGRIWTINNNTFPNDILNSSNLENFTKCIDFTNNNFTLTDNTCNGTHIALEFLLETNSNNETPIFTGYNIAWDELAGNVTPTPQTAPVVSNVNVIGDNNNDTYTNFTGTWDVTDANNDAVYNFSWFNTSNGKQLLVGYDFDINTTNLTDHSGFNNYGDVIGATYVDGKIGKALDFDGINDYVRAGKQLGRQINWSRQFTVTAWVKPKSLSGKGVVYYIFWVDDDAPAIRIVNSTSTYLWAVNFTSSISGGDVKFNEWQHLAISYNTTTICAYIDGVLITCGDKYYSGSNTLQALIGWDGTNGRQFNGTIDDFRVYNWSLSRQQILNINNSAHNLSYNETKVPSNWTFNVVSNDLLNYSNKGVYDFEVFSAFLSICPISGDCYVDCGTNKNIYENRSLNNYLSFTGSGIVNVWGSLAYDKIYIDSNSGCKVNIRDTGKLQRLS